MTTAMNTEIIAIIDRSGSMATIAADASGGFNRFVDDQRREPGEARLTLVDFDDTVTAHYEARPLHDVPKYTLKPRGSTALYDAIGRTLHVEAARIAAQKWAQLVIVVIVTDGGENASHEFNATRVKDMITHCEKNGWQFLFLAANQDAFATGMTLGTQSYNTANYAATPLGTMSAYAASSAKTSMLRGGMDSAQINTESLVNLAASGAGTISKSQLNRLKAQLGGLQPLKAQLAPTADANFQNMLDAQGAASNPGV